MQCAGSFWTELFVEWIIWMQYQLRFLASLSWLIIWLNYKNKWFNSVFIYLKACIFWLSFFSKSTNNSSASQLQSDITTCVSLSWFNPWFRPMTLKIGSVWFTNWFSWFTKKNHTNNCTIALKKICSLHTLSTQDKSVSIISQPHASRQ